jgi:ribose transport system ATP-binding protein
MTDLQPPIIEVVGVSKDFGAVRALDNVSLDVRVGEVHGLVGENGAGKSTLMKILSGLEQPTRGRLLLRGRFVTLRHPREAQAAGIAMIHQDLNLVEDLSVADNLFLGREKRLFGFVRGRAMRRDARRMLDSLHGDIDPAERVRGLSVAQKQMVEIARAIGTNASLLIMDEPTAVLSGREVTALLEQVERLKRQGVSILYISHRLEEVLQICDRITVLRDGQVVTTLGEARVKQATEAELAGLMVGRAMGDYFPERGEPGVEVALAAAGVSVPGKVVNASFEVRRGEILGFAGLIGAGRTELAEAVAGLRPRSAGKIAVEGKPVAIRSPRDAVRARIAYVSEDRKGSGLTLGMGIAENMTMVSLKRYARPLISRRAETLAARGHVERLGIKVGHVRDKVATLSGGNQQKVVLAKWLETFPRVLIIDEPTRGVDIGAKQQIYALIRELTARGMACILISSELNEVLGLSHRIAVMRHGRIVATVEGKTATEESIMRYAAGVGEGDKMRG